MDDFDFDDFDFAEFDVSSSGVDLNRPLDKTPSAQDIVTNLRRRSMLVVFVIDVSGSMRGARIGAVNDAIRNLIPELKKKERGNTSAEIKIAILQFSSNAVWRTPSPLSLSEFNYDDITDVGGCTNYGNAFRELNKKLSKDEFLKSSAGAYTPLIIFLTDGKPSDIMMYREELRFLKQNKWFKYSARAGIAIEEGALSPECKNVLIEFTENEKNVYEAKNTIVLARQIQLVTLTGVDLVTQQGSLQNKTSPTGTGVNIQRTARSGNSSSGGIAPSQQASAPPRTAPSVSIPDSQTDSFSSSGIGAPQGSPTLPTEEINWENEFDF